MKYHCLMFSGLLWLSLGCIGPNHRPSASLVSDSPRHIVQKNYVIGEEIRVKPGETMVKVKDYWVQNSVQGSVILDRQITIITNSRVSILPHGRVLRNLGPIAIQDAQYMRYADASDDDGISPIFYARPDGTLADFVYVRGRSGLSSGFDKILNISDISYKFPPQGPDRIMAEREQVDYAILFRGKDGNGVRLTCIDFSGLDGSQQSREEEVAVPPKNTNFGYRNLHLEFKDTASGDLAFTVLSD
jgi:hypothetical protein